MAMLVNRFIVFPPFLAIRPNGGPMSFFPFLFQQTITLAQQHGTIGQL
jgi:hypothetical protein